MNFKIILNVIRLVRSTSSKRITYQSVTLFLVVWNYSLRILSKADFLTILSIYTNKS